MCVFMVAVGMHATAHIGRSEDNSGQSVLALHLFMAQVSRLAQQEPLSASLKLPQLGSGEKRM